MNAGAVDVTPFRACGLKNSWRELECMNEFRDLPNVVDHRSEPIPVRFGRHRVNGHRQAEHVRCNRTRRRLGA